MGQKRSSGEKQLQNGKHACVVLIFVSLNVSNNSEYFFLKQVASIYKDPSIGNLINIVIVKLVVVHNEQVMEVIFFTFCLTVAFVVSIVMNKIPAFCVLLIRMVLQYLTMPRQR